MENRYEITIKQVKGIGNCLGCVFRDNDDKCLECKGLGIYVVDTIKEIEDGL